MPWFARVWGTADCGGALMPIPGISFKWEALFVGLLLTLRAGLTALLAQKNSHSGLWLPTATGGGVGLLFSPVLLLSWLG
jgi:hypothetical protein